MPFHPHLPIDLMLDLVLIVPTQPFCICCSHANTVRDRPHFSPALVWFVLFFSGRVNKNQRLNNPGCMRAGEVSALAKEVYISWYPWDFGVSHDQIGIQRLPEGSWELGFVPGVGGPMMVFLQTGEHSPMALKVIWAPLKTLTKKVGLRKT